jgi:hypothetical protein
MAPCIIFGKRSPEYEYETNEALFISPNEETTKEQPTRPELN